MKLKKEFTNYLTALGIVAVATGLFFLGRDYFAKGQWALLYLLIILFIASINGVKTAIFASILSFLAWNYFFLPPFYTFIIHDPKDLLSLFAFLIVSILIGIQAGRLKERETQAKIREQETLILYKFSGQLVSEISILDMAKILINEVINITMAKSATIFLADESSSLNEFSSSKDLTFQNDSRVKELAEWSHEHSKAIGLPGKGKGSFPNTGDLPISVSHYETGVSHKRDDIFIPLQTATQRFGVLYIDMAKDRKSYTDSKIRIVVSIANQASAFLERKHLQSMAVQADALREADRLKSTLISSVSHELKTPLSSLTATITNLLQRDVDWDPLTIKSELETLHNDIDRLNASISSLVDLSKLESATWEPKRDYYEFGEIIGKVLSKLRQDQLSKILVDIPGDLPLINVDYSQWTCVFQNLIENALTYSYPDSTIRINASYKKNEVKMLVEDSGPGISKEEHEKIFTKFYRGKSSKSTKSGTGLGLAIVKEIVRFHGGKIWVEDVIPHGARFIITLPLEN
ncbi:MAG: ATP-binding protein [Actinobacteria bacterium]|nr:ATP-binding protein [Actinomycetota bacterium]MCL5985515.1 ATP-binding protein [Actinomycetota bacterium]